jgi:hypothetical protein
MSRACGSALLRLTHPNCHPWTDARASDSSRWSTSAQSAGRGVGGRAAEVTRRRAVEEDAADGTESMTPGSDVFTFADIRSRGSERGSSPSRTWILVPAARLALRSRRRLLSERSQPVGLGRCGRGRLRPRPRHRGSGVTGSVLFVAPGSHGSSERQSLEDSLNGPQLVHLDDVEHSSLGVPFAPEDAAPAGLRGPIRDGAAGDHRV